MAVNRCICKEIRFIQALVLARAHGCSTVAELQEVSALGTGCGLCIPYMQRAIVTSETDLPVFDQAETARWMVLSGLIQEGG